MLVLLLPFLAIKSCFTTSRCGRFLNLLISFTSFLEESDRLVARSAIGPTLECLIFIHEITELLWLRLQNGSEPPSKPRAITDSVSRVPGP